jgi:hypothetical protein
MTKVGLGNIFQIYSEYSTFWGIYSIFCCPEYPKYDIVSLEYYSPKVCQQHSCSDLKEDKFSVRGLAMIDESVNSMVMDDSPNAQTIIVDCELEQKWLRKC